MPTRAASGVARAALVVVALVLVALVALWGTSPVNPEAWSPPAPPALTGPLAPNDALQRATLLFDGTITGPEDTCFDEQGRLYLALADGRVVRTTLSRAGDVVTAAPLEEIVNTGGRPLGLHVVPASHAALTPPSPLAGQLLVADADKGLLAVDLSTTPATLRVLVAEAEGARFLFTDEVETDARGQVYFTDASSRFGRHDYTNDLIEGRGHGRFMRYDPFTQTTTVLLRDLRFANGVALAPDDSYALINETGRYRVWRYWLQGDKAGTAELFIENLPGFPDNIDLSPRGTFWIAQFTLRKRILDVTHPSPVLKRFLAALPELVKPKAQRYGLMLEVDAQGKILRSLHDPRGDHVPHVTSVNERDGVVVLGNLTSPNLPALVLR